MSERKTRGRQRIPIRLIENKDDLLVSFSKRRVGVYKKASELSTLCGVDVGAIIFSPSGIPHSFFTPDFDTVVHGRRNTGQQRDGHGRVVEGSPRTRIRELNKLLDEVIEQQERDEKREKLLDATVGAAEMGWWEVPVENLNVEQVKEQIEWFQTLKTQIKSRVQELKNGGASSAAASPPRDGEGTGAFGGGSHVGGECFFAPPPPLDAYTGGGGTGRAGDQYIFPPPPPPPPPPQFDAGGGSSLNADHQYLFAPPSFGGGSGFIPGRNCYTPPSLNLFGGGGIGHVPDHYFRPPSLLRGGSSHFLADGYGEAGPSHP